MELVAARIGDEQVEVTLADGIGLIRLIGTPDEIVALCEAMDETALLAGVREWVDFYERFWDTRLDRLKRLLEEEGE